METAAPPSLLPHLWKATLVSGVVAVILGVLVFFHPGPAIIVTAVFFAAYLLVTGIWQVFLALSLRSMVGGRVLLFVSGAAALVLGVMCFVSMTNSDDNTAIELLAIWIGVGFIFRGVATAMSALGDHSLPGRIWEIVVGIISVLAGIVMFAAPVEGLVAVTQVTGVILVVIGVAEIVTAFGIRSDAKKIDTAVAALDD